MLKTIVVPLDGSAFAQRALPYAQVVARRADARVILLRAIEGGYSPSARELAHADMRDAREELAMLAAQLERQGVATSTARPFDEASWAIITAAQEESADLIVMSTHGRTGAGRWVYGSVAERVLRVAPAPLLLVPPATAFNWPSDPRNMRIVVPLDGSAVAEAILAIAADVAEVTGGTIILAQAFLPPPWAVGLPASQPPYDPVEAAEQARESLSKIASGLEARRIRTELYVHEGRAHDVILDAAAVHQAHMIAMSTHGRTGLARLITGSVTDAVMRETRIALLLARPPASALSTDEEGALDPAVREAEQMEAAQEGEPVAILMTIPEISVIARALGQFVEDGASTPGATEAARGLLQRLAPHQRPVRTR